MAGPRCHYCDRPAEEQCPTCGRLFCPDHGEDVCLRCMAPASATPGATVYRGSLLALVAGTAVALYLIVSPPASEGAPGNVRTFPTPTPAVVATATPTPAGQPSPNTTGTAPATPGGTPGAATTGTPTPATQTYTVEAGDTLEEIAARFGTDVATLQQLNPGVTPENLQAGGALVVPAR